MTAPQDSTARVPVEVEYVPILRGEPERVCRCGFYVEDPEAEHEGCR